MIPQKNNKQVNVKTTQLNILVVMLHEISLGLTKAMAKPGVIIITKQEIIFYDRYLA